MQSSGAGSTCDVVESAQCITSNTANLYGNNEDCEWVLTGDSTLEVLKWDVEDRFDALEITRADSTSIGKFTGTPPDNSLFTPTGSIFGFTSDDSVVQQGFVVCACEIDTPVPTATPTTAAPTTADETFRPTVGPTVEPPKPTNPPTAGPTISPTTGSPTDLPTIDDQNEGAMCIAVIDESSPNDRTEGFIDKWDQLRERWPSRPFCLVHPTPSGDQRQNPEGLLYIPEAFNTTNTEFQWVVDVVKDDFRDAGEEVESWYSLCRLDAYRRQGYNKISKYTVSVSRRRREA